MAWVGWGGGRDGVAEGGDAQVEDSGTRHCAVGENMEAGDGRLSIIYGCSTECLHDVESVLVRKAEEGKAIADGARGCLVLLKEEVAGGGVIKFQQIGIAVKGGVGCEGAPFAERYANIVRDRVGCTRFKEF